MRTTTTEKLSELQRNPANIRNMCIMAHVDHGKTTLADTLVASNGIISRKMAGKLRYLDSREDEQLRGITMKSSAISLHFSQDDQDYLINLIDSPGHIDFSCEVSTAVRLCDGTVILVDVVEGVRPQTHAVLRQAWLENLKPVLMLNKVDRLITELKMTPLEAHIHLKQILEQVNAITGALFTTEVMGKSSNITGPISPGSPPSGNSEKLYDWSYGLDDADDEHLYFSPDQGNVMFGSAIDGWGFSIEHFAHMWATKLGINATVLLKTLWGDFYLENKTKRIKKGAQAKGKKPLFVQFILESLWAVYDAVMVTRDKERIDKIVSSLNLKILPRDARHADPRVQLTAICAQWIPLPPALLSMVVSKLPSPLDLSSERVEKLLCPKSRRFDSLPLATQQLKSNFLNCSQNLDAPTIVYVSKMIAVDRSYLPENRRGPLTANEMAKRRELARQRHADKMAAQATNTDKTVAANQDVVVPDSHSCHVAPIDVTPSEVEEEKTGLVFMAFARVFSGCVRRGQTIYVLGPKHDPATALEQGYGKPDKKREKYGQHIHCVTLEELYLFMGRELEALEEIPAGNILGIGGLEETVLKTATLSDTVACPAFTDMYFEASPIVRVAVEAKHASEMGRLVEGLRLLTQADPCVETFVQENGELIMITAGEVHLQKCLDDLRDRFANIELTSSAAIVPFRETVVLPPTIDMVNEAIQLQVQSGTTLPSKDSDDEDVLEPGLVRFHTANQLCTGEIKACPLPLEVTRILESSSELLRTLDQYSVRLAERLEPQNGDRLTLTSESLVALRELRGRLDTAFREAGEEWEGAVDQIWAFGPRRVGPNILLNRVPGYQRHSVWYYLDKTDCMPLLRNFDSSIVSGFQMATLAGPLCEEPIMGVCFSITQWNMDPSLTARSRLISEGEGLQETELSILNSTSTGHVKLNNCDTTNITSNIDAITNKTTSTSGCVLSADTTSLPLPSEPEAGKAEAGKAEAVSSKRRDPTSYGPFSGQLMSCVKDGCRRAFQTQPQRMMAAMYKCEIQVSAEVLGKMYAVLSKRSGRILEEDLQEGSAIFNIQAVLPVIESFGFAEEIRKKTSGLAIPQLQFSHWEVVDIDPFWVPTTEEEYLQYGEKADSANRARIYMNKVRRRKGLRTDEKIVEFAEKQRTLTRNK